MKKILILWAALLCSSLFHVHAQGVYFRDLSYQEALETAKKENKLVFMDCYTSWCGPCQNMLKNVFTLPEAGEFMTGKCVCVKYDMEKGEGIDLRKQFNVRSYPTFFIIRPDGTVQHRLVGGSTWERFRMHVERGLNEKTSLYYLENRYRAGRLVPKEYANYVQALRDASRDGEVEAFCREVFEGWGDKERCRKENWFLYEQEMSLTDERFVYLLEHKASMEQQVGKEVVDKQIYDVYFNALALIHGGKSESWVELCGVMIWQLKGVEFEGKDEVAATLDYVVAVREQDVEQVLVSLEQHRKSLPVYVTYDLLGKLNFIAEAGSAEQVGRYQSVVKAIAGEVESASLRQLLDDMLQLFEDKWIDCSAYAEIKGKVTRDRMEQVYLYEVVDGQERLVATSQLGKDGLYGFAFQPAYSGFYTVGGERCLDRVRLYLKPGDCGEVDIIEDSLIITRRNTPENLLLARWEALMMPVRERVDNLKYALFNYQDFYPYFVAFLPKAEEFKQNINFRDETFVELVRQTVDFDLDYYAFRILNALKATKEVYMRDGHPTHLPSRPKPEDYPEYYKTLVSKEKLADASILKQPYGYDYVERYTTFANGGFQAEFTLADRLAWLPCDLLKAEMVLREAEHCRYYDAYMELLDQYGNLLTTPNHQKRVDAVTAKLYQGTKGKPAADFTYPDRQGKQVSLSDFRGKVVVVDVWATWCGPCRVEIPHLVKLEKEMHGKDVVFIGVSVDVKKDYDKWLDVLEKEGLAGIQLFTGGDRKIMNDYKIKGIPRFMVFDRQGNVVTTKSPRPSNPELKKLLLELLAMQ